MRSLAETCPSPPAPTELQQRTASRSSPLAQAPRLVRCPPLQPALPQVPGSITASGPRPVCCSTRGAGSDSVCGRKTETAVQDCSAAWTCQTTGLTSRHSYFCSLISQKFNAHVSKYCCSLTRTQREQMKRTSKQESLHPC